MELSSVPLKYQSKESLLQYLNCRKPFQDGFKKSITLNELKLLTERVIALNLQPEPGPCFPKETSRNSRTNGIKFFGTYQEKIRG